jgi:hypothetical protein
MARTSRNNSRDKHTTRIYDAQGSYECRQPDDDAYAMKMRGDLVDHYEPQTGRWIGFKRVAAPSDSNASPACLTFGEMLATVGISRHRFGDVTTARQKFVLGKRKEFELRPSWKYRGKKQGYGTVAV